MSCVLKIIAAEECDYRAGTSISSLDIVTSHCNKQSYPGNETAVGK